ncbi:hypothetical protein BGZ94_000006 [Podila epigama]|nr:hypothetical protein BGZ94_000006 [Podila epigama]
MSKAFDPLKRLVGSLNARFAHLRAFPNNALPAPPPAQPHLHHPHGTTAFKQTPAVPTHFQLRTARPAHRDGPLLLNHLSANFNNLAKRVFLPEPARVAAVNYACQSAGRAPMPSLLAGNAQRMLHHQPLAFAVPRGFAKNVGLSSSRGFCSAVGPAANGPVRLMAQMYAKPIGALSSQANKKSVDPKSSGHKKAQRKHRRGEIKKSTPSVRPAISAANIKAFLARAAKVEQEHQTLVVCNAATEPLTTATAISMAKAAGKTMSELNELPTLRSSDDCPTNVDMCFMLDASPLWHLDTMVSALHTDSLKAPKQLNGQFIENLLEVTEYQYQHFMEVSAILQRLVQCPQAREISLHGYELRVHFAGTTLFDMGKFLQALGVDPKSPHFDLEEIYIDASMDQYFPQASVNDYYYASSLMSEDTWDDCSSIQTSLIYANSEFSTSVVSLVEMSQESPWEAEEAIVDEKTTVDSEATVHSDDFDAMTTQRSSDALAPIMEESAIVDIGMYPTEDPWAKQQEQERQFVSSPVPATVALRESTLHLDALSSQILSSTHVSDEYFDSIRGFLDGIEAVHRHADQMYNR